MQRGALIITYPAKLSSVPKVQGIANLVTFPLIREKSKPKESRLKIKPIKMKLSVLINVN